ncbi:MAG: hypothetical protein ACXVCD_17160 [Pseudobdellovibrionaceae bacterium]
MNHSRFFIPTPTSNNDNDAFQWRIHLIRLSNVLEAQRQEELEKLLSGKLSPESKKNFIKYILSGICKLSEVEIDLLFVTSLLITADKLEPILVVHLSKKLYVRRLQAQMPDTEFLQKHHDEIELARKELFELGLEMVESDIRKIRAKIAIKELITPFAPNLLIPDLVRISPRYLKCDFVNRWLEDIFIGSRSLDKSHKEASIKLLNKFHKSLRGDGRQLQKLKYDKYGIYFAYQDLIEVIDAIRKNRNEPIIEWAVFQNLKEEFKINDIYIAHILSNCETPRQLAIAILIQSGHIENEDAFEDIQAHVESMIQYHPNIQNIPITNVFLSVSKLRPSFFSESHVWNILESLI